MVTSTARPRTLRPAPEPLGSFIRPGYNDHTVLAQALAEGRGSGSGLVINPVHAERQVPLIEHARAAGVETVLDSKSLELSSPGGYAMSGVPRLPWASEVMQSPLTLSGPGAGQLVRSFSEYAAEARVSAVLAPTHLLGSADSPWWAIDATLTRALRQNLNELELRNALIYYPVMVRTSTLATPGLMEQLIEHLSGLPIDGVWLRLHPFGTSSSGPLALKRYLALCRQLHALGIPIVAEHSGNVGVALLAFGAVGGIESGVTFTDTVNLDGILRAPKPDARKFLPPARVYLHQIGAFLDPKVADSLFAKRGMKSLHGCHDTTCCPRGWSDQVANPRGHFLRERAREVAQLSAMPPSLRAGYYMENFLRPATDRAVRAAELEPALLNVRKRLDSWRRTLGAELEQRSDFSISAPAAGRRLRVRPSA
ncbi:hypothetical protein [Rathayibacter sp. VKM Ac-2928]|uniref:hypothetical protein n=1 Tax=Rathayibacter sp. VKM Ac-2928 TaxID=2929479 RepID=UPI001FB37D2D|nr:hypothetical protein [Rathayibacter sp. VKM Ac-2928]MCJ1685342.1 hypothetical protein [Rathayibacter sp. VKM Ac-2928]